MALKERKALAKVLAAALSGFRRSWFSLLLNRAAVPHSGGGRAAVSGKRRGARRDRRAGLWPQKTERAALCLGLPGAIRTAWTERAPAWACSGLLVDLEEHTWPLASLRVSPVWYTHSNMDSGGWLWQIQGAKARRQSSMTVTYEGDDGWGTSRASHLHLSLWLCPISEA